MKFISKLLTSHLLILSLLLHSASVHAFTEKLGLKAGQMLNKAIVKSACKKMGTRVGGTSEDIQDYSIKGTAGEIGCESLNLAMNQRDVNVGLMNIVLLLTMVVSVVNSKCSTTKDGKEFKPKSHTANVTHWIHKLAAVAYIYAFLKSSLEVKKIYDDLEDKVKENPEADQIEFSRNHLAAMNEEKASLEKKKKLMKIASVALGAAAAVEGGLIAANMGFGAWMQMSEAQTCSLSKTELANCANPGASALNEAKKTSFIQDIKTRCVAKFKNINLAGSLVRTARNKVVGEVTKQISKQVVKAIGEESQTLGQAAGTVVARKAAFPIDKFLQESLNQVGKDCSSKHENDAGVRTEKCNANLIKEFEDLKSGQCVKDEINHRIERWLKEKGAAAAVAATYGTPAAPAAIAANCGLSGEGNIQDCKCAIRNIGGLAGGLARYKQDLSFKSVEDMKKKKGYIPLEGVKKDEEVCAVDYVNWGVRHDLSCVPLFSDQTDEERNVFNPQKIFEKFNQEIQKFNGLSPYKMASLLNMHQHVGLVDYLSQGEMTQDYLNLAQQDKDIVDQSLQVITESILGIKDLVLPVAHAEDVPVGPQSSIWNDLGITAVGIILIAYLYHPVTDMVTELHKSPLRRMVLFLSSYSMASVNVSDTEKTVEEINKNIQTIQDYIDLQDRRTFQQFLEFINPIPTAHASSVPFANNQAILCMKGNVLDKGCECRKNNSCGYSAGIDSKSDLYRNGDIMTLIKGQSKYINRASQGKAGPGALNELEYTSLQVAKELDPMSANRSMRMMSQMMKFGDFNPLKTSQRFLSSIKQQAAQDLELTISNSPPKLSSHGEKFRKKSPVLKEKLKEATSPKTLITPTMAESAQKKMKKQVDRQKDDAVSAYEEDSTKDLFQIISKRYQRVYRTTFEEL